VNSAKICKSRSINSHRFDPITEERLKAALAEDGKAQGGTACSTDCISILIGWLMRSNKR
jgi:hypothetical protein